MPIYSDRCSDTYDSLKYLVIFDQEDGSNCNQSVGICVDRILENKEKNIWSCCCRNKDKKAIVEAGNKAKNE